MPGAEGDFILNPTKRLLEQGGFSLLFSIRQTRSVEIVLAAKSAGYDSLYVDLEHGALTIGETGQICVTALAAGITPLVRVPAGATDVAAQVLDLGAMGIIAPHITCPADAERMVDCCKYPPVGSRSNSATIPQQWLTNLPFTQLQARVNEETTVYAMIETAAGLDCVDNIAAVPGIDVLLVGTSDLSAELGIPGQFGSDLIIKAFERVIAAARKHGKYVSVGGGIKGGAGSSATILRKLRDMGVRQLSVGNDVSILTAAMRQRVTEINDVMK